MDGVDIFARATSRAWRWLRTILLPSVPVWDLCTDRISQAPPRDPVGPLFIRRVLSSWQCVNAQGGDSSPLLHSHETPPATLHPDLRLPT